MAHGDLDLDQTMRNMELFLAFSFCNNKLLLDHFSFELSCRRTEGLIIQERNIYNVTFKNIEHRNPFVTIYYNKISNKSFFEKGFA